MDLKTLEEKMHQAVQHFSQELNQIRTGRAHPGLVENIMVEAYGTRTPIKGLASVSTPEPRVILISPWDKSQIPGIEKAIQQSGLGLNPTPSGDQIRLALPELTVERRAELSKLVNTNAEKVRVGLRNVREEYLKEIKADVTAKKVSEDELEHAKKEVQKVIDKENQAIQDIVDKKIKLITEV